MVRIYELSTEMLLDEVNLNDAKILDVRDTNAYNGWKLKGEIFGGHISKSFSLPSKWCNFNNWIKIVESKDIAKSDRIIVYSYCDEDSIRVLKALAQKGYSNLYIYRNYLKDQHLLSSVLNSMENYSKLVPPSYLAEKLKEKFLDKKETDFQLFHVHYNNKASYNSGHIPGAVELNLSDFENKSTWNIKSVAQLENQLKLHGINKDSTVVLYGKFFWTNSEDNEPNSFTGQLSAMRCAYIMMYAGIKDVRILNGGLQAWLEEGYSLSIVKFKKTPSTRHDSPIDIKHNLLVTYKQISNILNNKIDKKIISVRSRNEHKEEYIQFNFLRKSGVIPNSIILENGTNPHYMENFRNEDNTVKTYTEVLKKWQSLGLTFEKDLIFYCCTGWRASEAFMLAYFIGYKKISIYDGGWFEWSKKKKLLNTAVEVAQEK